MSSRILLLLFALLPAWIVSLQAHGSLMHGFLELLGSQAFAGSSHYSVCLDFAIATS